MKIVIAPDSFKGSLSAREAGLAIERGVRRAIPDCETIIVPMADGGEGTVSCLVEATDGRLVQTTVKDPLGREVQAEFGILGGGETCVIEMAASSGLYLIGAEERNPLLTTTYGFGQLIKAGLDEGCRQFILGLGGSATNDGGAGMLQALGADLLDKDGHNVGLGGAELAHVTDIRTELMDPRLIESTFIVACDVGNPFCGPNGASYVFGPQKGATPEMAAQLDESLGRFADVIERTRGYAIHDIPGTGAAGGLAGGILAFLNAGLDSGIDIVMEVTGLERRLVDADLLITGEGRIDSQTAEGKTPCGVARLAKKHLVPAIGLAGSVGGGIEALYEEGLAAVLSIVNGPMTLEEAMSRTAELLEQASEQAVRVYNC
ncbi:glycerate kinase [Paenibacillus aurantius]|uniref:Glycerate kinase n=1 Tax=Paenibacillus aurantius TaxID=2918900 RepID=A0AA96LFU6_9BACL|nr:glycerate kinase [Paenibacillus aurantius]WNQ11315.1 glycerate kinase [Paenibacillus aurantius]